MDQQASIDLDSFGGGDRARFFRATRHGGLECLTASFREHRYAPHSHETFVVGVIEAGCEAYRLGGVRHYAGPGEVCFVNPGEVHDGEPADAGYAYRMTYPSEDLMRAVAAEVTGRDRVPRFREPLVADAEAAALFSAAHRRLESGASALGADEALVGAYALLIARHADVGATRASVADAPDAVARARDYLDAHHGDDVDLDTLARVAGLSRHHLIRAFKRATGLTPHAFLTDRRVRAARRLLAEGRPPAEVAALCGFCDQSHLNRAFKARIGVAPGAFRVA